MLYLVQVLPRSYRCTKTDTTATMANATRPMNAFGNHSGTGSNLNESLSDFTKVVFLFAGILSLLGNLVVLALFLRNRKWLRKTYGRFIFALAAVDVLTALSLLAIPIAVHEGRGQTTKPRAELAREVYCRLVWSHYILFSFGVTSVYTCFALTVERWVAVARPFYHRNYKASKSLLGIVVLPWLAGFVLEADIVYETGVNNFDDGSFVCTWAAPKSRDTTSAALAISSFFGAIFLPAVLIVAMYAHILAILQGGNSRPCQAHARHLSAIHKLAFRRATKMAACATIAVVICWLPCQTYSLLAQLGYAERETTIHRMLNLLAFLNSCLNPFIYAFSNELYRRKLTETFSKLNCQNPANSSGDGTSVFV